MNCAEAKDLMHAYADGELDLVHALEMEKHLADCAACSRAYENIRSLKSALKSDPLYFKAPLGLERRIQASLYGEKRKPATAPFAWTNLLRIAIPVAAAAVLAFLLIPIFTRPSIDERLVLEVTASHVRSLMADHRTDIASSNQHTVKPWFEGKLDFAPTVVDLTQQGFPLVGGRLDYIEGRPAAALVYQRNKHSINLFIWPASTKSDRSEKATVQKGYNLIHWRASGMNYWAISDLNAAELKQFVELLMKNGAP
jgi:anti-sigma factor RsiW